MSACHPERRARDLGDGRGFELEHLRPALTPDPSLDARDDHDRVMWTGIRSKLAWIAVAVATAIRLSAPFLSAPSDSARLTIAAAALILGIAALAMARGTITRVAALF